MNRKNHNVSIRGDFIGYFITANCTSVDYFSARQRYGDKKEEE